MCPGRCRHLGIPFCHQGCPLGNIIPDWNDLVYRGQWQEALDRLLTRRPALAFAARSCEEALHALSDADVPYQDSLFGAARPRRAPAHLETIFTGRRAASAFKSA